MVTFTSYTKDIFEYPEFDFSGDFIAGSGISQDDRKSLIPVGTIAIWFEEKVPENWLECDGQPINPKDYPDLYKMMKFTPNFKGMFLRGVGSQSFAQKNGTTVGITNTVHSSAGLGHIQGDSIRNIYGDIDSGLGSFTTASGAFFLHKVSGSAGTFLGSNSDDIRFDASRIVPTSTENRPVNIAVKYIIKAL